MKKSYLLGLLLLLCSCILASATEYVTSSNLKVRAEAQKDAKVLGSLSKGSVVDVKEIVDGWAVVDYNGTEAYVSADYISKKTDSSAAAQSDASASKSAPWWVVGLIWVIGCAMLFKAVSHFRNVFSDSDDTNDFSFGMMSLILGAIVISSYFFGSFMLLLGAFITGGAIFQKHTTAYTKSGKLDKRVKGNISNEDSASIRSFSFGYFVMFVGLYFLIRNHI